MKYIHRKIVLYPVIFWVFLLQASCKKQDTFLSIKPDASLLVPASLNDFQLLLSNEYIFNNASDPSIGEITVDDYYVSSDTWSGLFSAQERNAYIWEKDIWQGASSNDWNNPYKQVFYANNVLEGIEKLSVGPDQTVLYHQIKGTALFLRSYAFYSLLQIFAPAYDSTTAVTDLGIVLRLSADFNQKIQRATVKICYDQVLKDLQTALTLLPVSTVNKLQPSKIATNALLARIYLAMRRYDKALIHADASLSQYSELVDFNTLTPGIAAISNSFLSEDIFHTSMSNPFILLRPIAIVDSNLYRSYNNNDLRKSAYFTVTSNRVRFRGTYDFRNNKFSGLANDETYLIRSECYAREGNTAAAMNDLNTLLVNRWKAGTFIPFTANSPSHALDQVLTERRKELCFRGIRFSDIKRLNKENYNIILTRVVNGKAYMLPANSPLYALPIPPNEIVLGGLQQNPR